MLSLLSPSEIQDKLAEGMKSARKRRKESRGLAAEKTGVPSATIRRFEDTGEISIRQFLMLAEVYGKVELINSVFAENEAKTMKELVNQNSVR